MAALICASLLFFNHQDQQSAAASRATESGSTEKPTYVLDEASLNTSIQAILEQNKDLNMSVSIIDLQTHKKYHWGETASYTAASIGKLITATAYLHKVEAGQASLNDALGNTDSRAQLTKLITKSDNVAWDLLNKNITKPVLQEYATSLGLTSYAPENNVMNSDDAALILDKLASYKLLDKEHTDFLLSLMKEADMRAFIVDAIPDGVEVYHKVGYLKDRLHDVAIIKKGDRSFVLAIFSKSVSSYDFTRGADVFGEVTTASVKAFFP